MSLLLLRRHKDVSCTSMHHAPAAWRCQHEPHSTLISTAASHIIASPIDTREPSRVAQLQAARRCEYTGQLYCHSCHQGNTACLPATVVHHWDFSARAVCTMAAEFLAATAGQPLLCVGAINPRLYASTPAVGRAHELRKQACTSLAAARSCGSEAQVMVSYVDYIS